MATPDLGSGALTIQATRIFKNCWPAGYRVVAPIASPLMVESDGYVRFIAGYGDVDDVRTWLAPVRKDFSFIGPNDLPTNRRARSPVLLTLNPLTLETALNSPTTCCNASAGGESTQSKSTRRVLWGNLIPRGSFCVNEVGDEIVSSYGGDLNEVARFNKYTGQRVVFSCATGSNWSGILRFNADGTFANGGTAPYGATLPFQPTAHTDLATYKVEATATGYKVSRSLGGAVFNIPLGYNPGAITDVKTANGLLFIQSVVGMDVIISVVKGDKTPPLTLPKLEATGYVPAPITNMTLGDGVEIKPLKIAQPDPNAIDTGAVDPKYRHAYLFPVVDGPAFVRVIHAYMDQHGTLPSDCRLWLFPTTWPEPSTRKNIPRAIGTPIARRNVGKVGSGLYRIDFDVTSAMQEAHDAQRLTIAFCLEGVAPPNYAASKVYLIDQTRLIAGSASPLPPSPVPTPLLDVTIKATEFNVNTARGGKGWENINGRMVAMSNTGVKFDDPNAGPSLLFYKAIEKPGVYNFSLVGIGANLTDDSCWFRINLGPWKLVDGFGVNLTTRLVGTTTVIQGEHIIEVSMREDGFAFDSIRIQQIS